MKVGLIGTGYVGLPTAVALAHIGHEVVATDSDTVKLEQLRRGSVPFYEEGLEELLAAEQGKGRLRIADDPADAVKAAEVVFVCVGTPPRATGAANLLALERVAEMIARHSTGDLVVVGKSTVPTGTAERIAATLARHNSEFNFDVVSNPEFLREGKAIRDSLEPTRIVVGADSDNALQVMRALYGPMIERGVTYIETDIRTAELAKHASNAFLSLKISYVNALARLCELSGADVEAIAGIMGTDPRIGRAHLNAGIGYGGYCFPKDLSAFSRLAEGLGYSFGLLDEVARINEEALDSTFRKVENALWNLEEKRVALLGLAFKPGTDDVRFAPALGLAERLLDEGATVIGYDPQAGANAKAEVPGLEVVADAYAALEGAHCAVVCTDWPEFALLDLARVRSLMTFAIVVDGRNIFEPGQMANEGFTYYPTGRPPVVPRDGSS